MKGPFAARRIKQSLLLSLALTLSVAARAAEVPPSPAPSAAPLQSSPAASHAEAQPAAEPSPPAPRSAEDERLPFMAAERRASDGEAPSGAGMLARTFGALLLIAGLIAASAWGLKKFGGARFGAAAEDAPVLKVMSSVSLGDKRSLAVVRFGSRVLLVGSTPQSVTLIAEQASEGEAADRTDEADDGPPFRSVADFLADENRPPFADELARAAERNLRAPSGAGREQES
jgi:flagellar biosynthetic protein FliO